MSVMKVGIFWMAVLTQQARGAQPFLKPKTVATAEDLTKVNVTNTFMETKLGPFDTEAEACDYCSTSYTKQGDAPAGPIAPKCVCMAYPDAGKFMMFCATPPSAAGYVADKKGCTCKYKDMENMGKTTCKAIEA
eukprot:CAMPEP_0197638134 /NCGR_PEP_ID=MMETSP1338-20131121/13142_1 /TAXON_ID=43686 ORGANISM="Pelagodinium beii, Strain RCC1491" /NCGR_SAMPLE_ID=MMETSP1338 /ASSEMBLY_ACC=CAM_ASM_000754 /LENGTH=133 /DNA_ID=CAMNT_0043210655 /DNA_START=53 /DNA_END=454 /DNA_ORIENTATION=-